MKKSIIWIVGATLASALAPHADANGHCATDEQVVFSCSTGEKVVSVCASNAGVQYRFGPLGAPEISYPEAKPTMYDGMVYRGELSFAGGDAGYVRFINNDYEYVVYSGEGRGWSQDGVVAVKAGTVVSKSICANPPTADFNLLEEHGVELDGNDVAFEVWELVPIE